MQTTDAPVGGTARGPFPLLIGWQTRDAFVAAIAPRGLPWCLVEGHEARAVSTHGQTLERLAERGGLSIFEALSVLRDENAMRVPFLTERRALPDLLRLLADHLQACARCR